jgi:hypothetical protein
MIPLETPGLKRTRMIKNSRLESVVEIFEGQGIGSGQVKVEALRQTFKNIASDDLDILGKLAELPSYDVYSLRILLREHDLAIKDNSYLQLSTQKQHELEGLMVKFTRPLIVHVYGDDHDIKSYREAIAMFRHPDVRKARENLQKIAVKLGIMLEQVPKFLEDYGDIFLSVSYYEDCLDLIDPTLDEFQHSVRDISTNRQLQEDRLLLNACIRVGAAVDKLRKLVAMRFETFSRGSEDMWIDIDAERFKRFRSLIEGNHVALGGMLCALSVKMDAWSHKFPGRQGGGTMNRADFIITEMQQGLDRVAALGRSRASSTAFH